METGARFCAALEAPVNYSMLAWLLSFCLVFSSKAVALPLPNPTQPENCTTIDFRQSFPLMQRDQGKIAWCYAHAAADYLQYSSQAPETISAADIAINYSAGSLSQMITFLKHLLKPHHSAQPPQTGLIGAAIKKIIPQGYCPESVLPSDSWTRVSLTDQHRTSVGLLDAIVEIFELQNQIHQNLITDATKLPAYYEFRNIGQFDLFELLSKSKKQDVLNQIRTKVCSGKRLALLPKLDSSFLLKSKSTYVRLNQSLNESMPVTIDFFGSVLQKYEGFSKRAKDLHTVLVYGRNFDGMSGECNYLIKDSHGSDCERYDRRIKCEGGYLWLPESKLSEALVSYLILQRH